MDGTERESKAAAEHVQTSQTSGVSTQTANTTDATVKAPETEGNTQENAVDKIKVRTQEDMWDALHKMANTKIVADQIWGETEITQGRVDKLLAEVGQSEYPDRDRLLVILNRWKDLDFSNAVEEHNYLWEKLEGTVGKATGLR
jgi:hypothetical protein